MRARSLVVTVTTVLMLVLALVIFAIAKNDPFVGTWKLNLEKSNRTGLAPKNVTVKFESQSKGLKFASDVVSAEGKGTHGEATFKFDGKDYPDASNPGATIAFTRVDPITIAAVYRKDGQEVGSSRAVVSKDGKTMTRTIKGKDAKGEDARYTLVFDKQ